MRSSWIALTVSSYLEGTIPDRGMRTFVHVHQAVGIESSAKHSRSCDAVAGWAQVHLRCHQRIVVETLRRTIAFFEHKIGLGHDTAPEPRVRDTLQYSLQENFKFEFKLQTEYDITRGLEIWTFAVPTEEEM